MSALPSSFDRASAVLTPVGDLSAILSMIVGAGGPNLASRPQRAAVAATSRAYPSAGARTSLRPMPGHRRHPASMSPLPENVTEGAEWLIRGLMAVIAAGATGTTATDAPCESPRFPFGKAWLHIETARLTDADGAEIPLTAMEYRLLKLFAMNRGRVLNRDQILEGAHDRSWDPFDRSIDIRISRIRKKIEVNPKKPEVIRTVRGIGYVYDAA